MRFLKIAIATASSVLLVLPAHGRSQETTRSASSAPSAANVASQPVHVITDLAHWQHPTKAVFAKYKVTLKSVTLLDRRATFQVAFPFDPQTQPNAATLQALCVDLLKANGSWSYVLVSPEDHLEIAVSWNAKMRGVDIDYHAI